MKTKSFLFLVFICFFFNLSFAQNKKVKLQKLEKVGSHPFFNKKETFKNQQAQSQQKNTVPFQTQKGKDSTRQEEIEHIHSDLFQRKKDGNIYCEGTVKFAHKGAKLFADEVIFYPKENFIKAIGHVKLKNPDGSVITANEMEYDGKSERGIAQGNVVMTDPKQTLKTETLYYDKLSNKAYYNTGGTISDGKSTTYSERGSYNVSTKTINLNGNIRIDNDKYTVEGANISQNQNTKVASFSGSTYITNKENPSQYLYTEQGTYHMNSKEAYLNKNSRIHYKGKVLSGDKMYYNQNTGFGKGEGNVVLNDPKENRFIKGGYGEIYEKKDSAMITQQPYAVKMLEKDSIYFSAEKILAYQKLDSNQVKKSYLRAFYKARLFKSNAQARADSLSFNETDGVLHFIGKPILWSGAKQVSGEEIEAYFNTEKEDIDSLKVIRNAIAISKADSLNNKDEFNQVKGKIMTVYYQDGEINLAKVVGNAQAITYADDQNEKTKETDRIGIALSSCGVIEVLFEQQKVEVISCNIGAQSDIYPMSKISKEKRFFPNFNWNTKDRLKKWQDIFVDSPNYPETKYISDNSLYEKSQAIIEKQKAKEEAKKPKRKRR